MVKKAEKSRMVQFITDRLEDSGRYNILKKNESYILISRNNAGSSPKLYVVLHNVKMPISTYKKLVQTNSADGAYTSNIFYKDDETFMVRLAERGHFKGNEKSLKGYSKEKRDRMIHLRGLEKEVLDMQNTNPLLVYFQPETDRLEEALRGYSMSEVELDYSHVGEDHPSHGFVRNRPSIDYKIANEMFGISEGGVCFKRSHAESRILILNPQNGN